MKGTLFSADFVKNVDGDAKLLEINTDTACIDNLASNIDFTDFYQVLSDNSITDLQVIYKSNQQSIIDRLEAQKPGGVTITKHQELRSSIFPTTIADAADRFILRLAYDENALLDVIYAKNDSYLHGLFVAAGSGSLLVPGKHEGVQSGYDNLLFELNGPTKPDFVVKKAAPEKVGLKFYKVAGSGSIPERIGAFTGSIDMENNIIMNYLEDGTNVAKSIRSYQVVYGTNLDLCWLGEYEVEAILPHTAEIATDSGSYSNLLPNQHYYEFATNDISDFHGIFYSESINREDGGADLAATAEIGTIYDSYFVSGSPDSENDLVLDQWYFTGREMPSGSYSTSSSLDLKSETILPNNAVRELQFEDGTGMLIGGANRILAFNPNTNQSAYIPAVKVEAGFDVFDKDGNNKRVSAHNILILEEDVESKLIDFGVEEVDNFVVSGSDVIVHNAPCFAAGTMINCWDGESRPIEEIVASQAGETNAYGVISWDFENEAYAHSEIKVVTETPEQFCYDLTFKWSTASGVRIPVRCTPDHPFYVVGKGWACIDPDALKEKTGMDSEPLVVGDEIFTGAPDGSVAELISKEACKELHTVYNLDNVAPYNNYFVYGMLVHNRFIFGCHTYDSKVEMADGTFKSIGEVKVGDKVKSIKDGVVVEGTVTDALIHETNDVVSVIETENGFTESNHPVLVDGKWIPAGNLGNKSFTFVDNFYNLEIDGNNPLSDHNFIVDGLVASGLGDNAELNAKYQRQPKVFTKHL